MKIILTILLSFTIKTAFGATYYFSQNSGDDKRNEKAAQNQSTPWRSINRLSSLSLKSGDSVLFKKGELWFGETLEPTSDGVIFGSYGGGPLPIIDGGKNLALNVSVIYRKRLIFESIAFKRTLSKGIVAQLGNAWSTANSGMLNSVIKNCRFYGGVIIQGSYNRFEGNLVDGKDNDGNGNGIWEHHQYCHHNTYSGNIVRNFSIRGIWTMIDTHHGLFENNTIYNCKLAGIDLDGADYLVYGHTVKGNTIYNIANDAIELENAFDCLVSENKMHNGGRSYIYIINYEKCSIKDGKGAANGIGAILNTTISGNTMIGGGKDEFSMAVGIHRAAGINIVNNTVFNFRSRFLDIDYQSREEVSRIKLINNIFSTMGTSSWYGMINFSGNHYDLLEEDDYNCLYNNGRTDIYADRETNSHKSLESYVIATGKATHSLSVDPKFLSTTNFCLNKNSPCLYAAKAMTLPDGKLRPHIGACQSP